MALTRLVNDYKDSVKVASTGANIDLGAAPNTLDGVSLAANDRILVKDQSPSYLNGIYRVTTLGTGSNGSWSRSSDFNDWREISPGAMVFVEAGSINGNAFYFINGGGSNVTIDTTAINFSKSVMVTPGQTFLTLPLSDLSAGTYQYARMSLSYQNYDVQFYFANMPFTGRVASFVGYNTYIGNYKIKDSTVTVNANKAQGYWGVETIYNVTTGQSPAGATTVPNPIFNTSPIPAGSCLVTAQFNTPLTITGNETQDVVVTMKLSINKSFEWIDVNGNGKWDVDVAGETVVDMGLRGLFPVHNH